MGRVCAVREDNQVQTLIAIKCDKCGAEIKPNPDIAKSGWTCGGWDNGLGTEKVEWDHCPAC